ncbi:serine protease [Glycomyces paridis]|uniref:serine protease n=1 Tax=Glycomyces paridis TaxID=2126555 RepID=UPI0013053D82|nr:serine protease [Glycomyces paridis]
MDSNRKYLARLGAGLAAGLGAAALVWTGTAANAEIAGPQGDFEAQIIGGDEVAEGQYPWLVGLGSPGEGTPWERQFCGGSVIAPTVVLTAAHCVEDAAAGDLAVFSGSVDLESADVAETAVADLHVAPGYNDPVAFANDWALLLLAEPVDAEPIGLSADPAVFDALETAGWGLTEDNEYPTVARWVEVPFIDDDACAGAYPGETDAVSMLCAGDLADGGIDSCSGDSGGPIMAPGEDGGLVLAGIVSWGYGSAEAGHPGVYAEVAEFDEAIAEVLADWGV